MANNFNSYGFTAANTEAYTQSQDWEFPLSVNIDDIDHVCQQEAVGLRRPMPFQPPRPQHAGAAVGGIEEETTVLEIPPPHPKKGGKGKGKGKANVNCNETGKRLAQRGKSFSKEEDRIICSAFLNVSKDPIIGTNQSSGGYYQRMHEYFVEHMTVPTPRSQVAKSNRWLTIQKAVNKFCGFLATVERIDQSGKTEKDQIDDAVKMYEDTEPWTFGHCWDLLKKEAKWSAKMLEVNTVGTSTRVNQRLPENFLGEHDQSQHDDNGTPSRPEGRDTAKKRRSHAPGENTASSTAIEVLQSMNERGQQKDEKEDTQMAQILQRKDAKIELQHNLISLQREDMEKRWELEKEKLMLTREEVQMRKEQTQVEMLKAEAHFMGQDLEKLAPHLKEYYISMQREIMERRGIRIPPNN